MSAAHRTFKNARRGALKNRSAAAPPGSAGSRSPLTPSRTHPRSRSGSGSGEKTVGLRTHASHPAAQPFDVRTIDLIHDRLHGAWADLKDCVDGRHGHGAKAQRIERDAAEVIAAACSQLRVLLRYARSLQPAPAPARDPKPTARKARR